MTAETRRTRCVLESCKYRLELQVQPLTDRGVKTVAKCKCTMLQAENADEDGDDVMFAKALLRMLEPEW